MRDHKAFGAGWALRVCKLFGARGTPRGDRGFGAGGTPKIHKALGLEGTPKFTKVWGWGDSKIHKGFGGGEALRDPKESQRLWGGKKGETPMGCKGFRAWRFLRDCKGFGAGGL